MPSIITIDNTRKNARSMTESQVMEYIDLMDQVTGDEAVKVDDSESYAYETTYSRGEKVRNAIKKFHLDHGKVEVRSIKDEVTGEYVATIAWKK